MAAPTKTVPHVSRPRYAGTPKKRVDGKVITRAPKVSSAMSSATATTAPKSEKSSDTAGLWTELHLRALNYTVDPNLNGNRPSDASWILKWSRKIPRYAKGCACNEHWQKWYGKNLPDYSSSETYFAWTVRAHNAVNERLKKPTFTVEEAKEYYTKMAAAKDSA